MLMFRIVQRGLSFWHSSRRQKTQHARSRVEGWLEARPIIDFFTSDPFWLSTWDRESRKFGEVVNFSATIHRLLTGRCASDINCTSGPSWQSSIDFKERNLGFRSCKDQQVACNNLQKDTYWDCTSTTDKTSGPRWLRSGN